MTNDGVQRDTDVAPSLWRRVAKRIDPAFVVLSFGVVWLTWANASLLADRTELRRGLAEAAPGLTGASELQAGDVVPSFDATTSAGDPVTLSYRTSAPVVLFVFDPRCGVCLRENPSWQRLTGELEAGGVQVSWISVADLDTTLKGLKRDGVRWPVTVMSDRGLQRAYRVASVPQIAVVGQYGRVLWAHHGAMSDDDHVRLKTVATEGRNLAGASQ